MIVQKAIGRHNRETLVNFEHYFNCPLYCSSPVTNWQHNTKQSVHIIRKENLSKKQTFLKKNPWLNNLVLKLRDVVKTLNTNCKLDCEILAPYSRLASILLSSCWKYIFPRLMSASLLQNLVEIGPMLSNMRSMSRNVTEETVSCISIVCGISMEYSLHKLKC